MTGPGPIHRPKTGPPISGRRGYHFSIDDVRYLTSAAAVDALAESASLSFEGAARLAELTRLRRVAGVRAAAVYETTLLRRRALVKFGLRARRWLLTEEALQQAPPAAVAAHRATRLAAARLHDLTCSVGVDLSFLVEKALWAVGSDNDPVRVAMASHNLGDHTEPRSRGGHVLLADALRITTRGLLPYADPARRDSAGRRRLGADTIPSVADLDSIHTARPAVLRLPPGIDYAALARPGEVEIVSLDGVAREAVLWPKELAQVSRRATVLTSAPGGVEDFGSVTSGSFTSDTFTSDDPEELGVGAASEWIVDPDPAVVRAGLVRQYAARHGLRRLDPHLAYLTGPVAPHGIRRFQVLDHAPFTEKRLSDWVRRDSIGTLEIKQRGTPVVPDELRRRMRPSMSRNTILAATVIIARVGHEAEMYWCRPVVDSDAASQTPS